MKVLSIQKLFCTLFFLLAMHFIVDSQQIIAKGKQVFKSKKFNYTIQVPSTYEIYSNDPGTKYGSNSFNGYDSLNNASVHVNIIYPGEAYHGSKSYAEITLNELMVLPFESRRFPNQPYLSRVVDLSHSQRLEKRGLTRFNNYSALLIHSEENCGSTPNGPCLREHVDYAFIKDNMIITVGFSYSKSKPMPAGMFDIVKTLKFYPNQ